MKKHLKKIVAALILLAVTIYSIYYFTNGKSDYDQRINPPIAEKDIPFDTYTFDADSGIVIETSTGSLVKIDPGSLADSTGKIIKGKVDLSIREFHDAESIFYSGIPMSTDSSRNNFLQSAGMIELRASSNGSKLDFAKDKSASVELASFRNSENYKLYHLGNDRNWNPTDTFISKINLRKSKGLEGLEEKFNPKQDLYLDLIANLELAPYLKPFSNLQWKVDAKDINDSLMEALRVNWDEVKVIPPKGLSRKYTLKFRKKMDVYGDTTLSRSFIAKALPFSSGKRVDRKNMKMMLDEQDEILVKMENEKKRIQQQADLVNSFKINKMGIWNVDKVMNKDNIITAEISFDFEGSVDLNVNRVSIYTIFIDENSVLEYLPKDWKKVSFPKNGKMKIRAVLPGGKLVEVGSDQITQKIGKPGKIKFTTSEIKFQ